MTAGIKTLLIDSNGAGWRRVLLDTALRGVLGITLDPENLPAWVRRVPLVARAARPWYGTLSYVLDWREAFCASPRVAAEIWNISNLLECRRRRDALATYPLIVVLHSAAGDSLRYLLKVAELFRHRQGALVVFFGNEYDLLAEKMAFVRQAGADYLCSQLPLAAAQWVYAECAPTRILALPHALNPGIYRPGAAGPRGLDLGFIGDTYPHFVGDQERAGLIEWFRRHGAALGLRSELRLDARIPRSQWAAFLGGCTGVIGAEAGTYYLDPRGEIIRQAKAYVRRHPAASFGEVFDAVFKETSIPHVSGKCISSRHFEPIGTQTCQVLLEGGYNGILEAGTHYIAVKKDLSNLTEALEQFRDVSGRTALVARTYEYVMDQHTYAHRVQTLLRTVLGEAPPR
jgi:hypothetical protein